MTNIGTIPDESFVTVKIGEQTIGKLDEGFLEKLKPGDVFVLGGETYKFKFSRGMVAQVVSSTGRPPTIPRWVSEMLPLSFDLANEIGRFRRLMSEKFCSGKSKEDIMKFINDYLYVDDNAANSIYEYFNEQFRYATIPSDKRIIVEHYTDERGKHVIFHSLYGRRVNDCLSRAIAFAMSRLEHKDVEIGINDNGFFIRTRAKVNVMKALGMLKEKELRKVLENAIEQTEVLKRRFRHCATRSLMILRNYKGRAKRVGRQQVSSMILLSAVKRISNDFTILKEARREVLEDLMDVDNARKILKAIEDGTIKVEEITTTVPSPFAFNLIIQGYSDLLRMEDKLEFIKRMHEMVVAKIALKEGRKGVEKIEAFDYNKIFEESDRKKQEDKDDEKHNLKKMAWNLKRVPMFAKEEIIKIIDGDKSIRSDVIESINKYRKDIEKTWPKELQKVVFDFLKNQ